MSALCRLARVPVLRKNTMELDFVFGLKFEDFSDRRLQTQVFRLGLAKVVHRARVLIRQRHIRVQKQVFSCPGFIVRLGPGRHIIFSLTLRWQAPRPC